MTNNYTIVGTEDDPEPKVADFMIQIRGPDAISKVNEKIREDGWEAAAQCICSHCWTFVPEEEQENHQCYSGPEEWRGKTHLAPI